MAKKKHRTVSSSRAGIFLQVCIRVSQILYGMGWVEINEEIKNPCTHRTRQTARLRDLQMPVKLGDK